MKKPKEWECSSCSAPATLARGDYQFTNCGLKNVLLIGVELIKCSNCGNIDPVISNMRDLMQSLALAVVKKPWKLSGDEIRYLRKYLRMTAEEFSRHVGVDKTTISKWENDKDLVGESSDRLIRALALTLGDGLRDSREDVVRKFPDIRSALNACEYRYDTETQHIEYA